MNQAEVLWREHAPAQYPPGVLPVDIAIKGTAFFPGGYGLWNPSGSLPLPPFPVGGVMVLGHDFHSEIGYRESVKRGAESLSQATWLNLLPVLARAGIEAEKCFFTNVFMGIREGQETTGTFAGASDEEFVGHCQRFLLRQIEIQRPALIITLGIVAPRQLACLSPELTPWTLQKGLVHLDKCGPLKTGVSFTGLAQYSTTVVAIVHPSLRSANIRHRSYKGVQGGDAESLMLRDARELAAL